MLVQLLGMIANGGMRQPSELAQAMNISPALLESMLADLERLGYLERIGATCRSSCKNCPAACVMASNNTPRVWRLTEKGRKAVSGQDLRLA